jgi:hypothetical protein
VFGSSDAKVGKVPKESNSLDAKDAEVAKD